MSILVVHKIPKIEVLRQSDPDQLDRLRYADPSMLQRLEVGAARQQRALEQVAESIDALGLHGTYLPRDLFDGPFETTKLVVAVGGDGTVLDASHRVTDQPMLGVNSDPRSSVGYFCACNADGLHTALQKWIDCRLEGVRLQRMRVLVNGVTYPMPCMNDILISARNPAMMARYALTAGRRTEEQSSSGIWISTPAGSTGGIRSAGGAVLPIDDPYFQYLVREPYPGRASRYELLRGVRQLDEGITVRSLMQDGVLYVDGPWNTIPFHLGDTVDIRRGPPLLLLGMDPDRREF